MACGGAEPAAKEPSAEGAEAATAVSEMAEQYMTQAGMAIADGDNQAALENYLEAARLYDESGEVTVERAEAHFLAASLAYQIGEKSQAIDEYDSSVEIYLRFSGNSKIKAANALNNMGTIYKELQDKPKARNCWERALNIYKEAPADLQNKGNMAKIEQNIRDLDEGF
jgi:tetratricopeptide (TPR) repeat protein